jgi:hypothetical protein
MYVLVIQSCIALIKLAQGKGTEQDGILCVFGCGKHNVTLNSPRT